MAHFIIIWLMTQYGYGYGLATHYISEFQWLQLLTYFLHVWYKYSFMYWLRQDVLPRESINIYNKTTNTTFGVVLCPESMFANFSLCNTAETSLTENFTVFLIFQFNRYIIAFQISHFYLILDSAINESFINEHNKALIPRYNVRLVWSTTTITITSNDEFLICVCKLIDIYSSGRLLHNIYI